MGRGINKCNISLSAVILLTVVKALTPQALPVFDWLFAAAWAVFAAFLAWDGVNGILGLSSRFSWKTLASSLAHFGAFLFIGATMVGSLVKESEYVELAPGAKGVTRSFVAELKEFRMDEYPIAVEISCPESYDGPGWTLELERTMDFAMPDTASFHESRHFGATSAAYVTARRGEESFSGWVSCENCMFEPLVLELPDSCFAYMPQRAPKAFASDVVLTTMDGRSEGTVSVGRPLKFGGWRIYQSGYDTAMGRWSQESALLCVRDPFAPVRAAGLWMLIASALAMLVAAPASRKGSSRAGFITVASVVFTLLFTWIVLKEMGIGKRQLPPVLRSGWFIPHLAAYMVGYAVLATATIAGIWSAVKGKDGGITTFLVRIGWGLLTVGLTIGALWAKEAWGDFWSWDPKETWAAATWLCYLLYLHIPPKKARVAVLILAFCLLQMCWWGLKLLPTVATSMHLYA